jgi:antitoxin (DNA-binding transcriptional repressor) of toxin-antitoxin stability system
MKKTVISVTEAARNFADCINRVHYQNVSDLLLKNGSPVARLVPADEKPVAGVIWPKLCQSWICRRTRPTPGTATWRKARKALKLRPLTDGDNPPR